MKKLTILVIVVLALGVLAGSASATANGSINPLVSAGTWR